MSIGIFDYKELYTLYDSVLHEANFDYFRKLNRLKLQYEIEHSVNP